MSDNSSDSSTKPILTWAAALYRPLEPLAWPAIRVITGLNLIPHGAQKLFGAFGGSGLEATAAGFEKMGYTPGAFWATMVACTEVFGGILIAIGLLTRPAAVAATIFLATAVTFHMGNGFFVGKGGYEYALMWAVLAAAIAVRGGGRFSVDRAIGREF
ncbi:MAG: DoxX family protein [Alphaproteobacteria bacterium]